MGQLKVSPFSIADLLHRLNTEKGFSFARYGDGTFLCLTGSHGFNCDGASIDSSQAAGLRESLKDDSIAHGIGGLAVDVGAIRWLKQQEIDIEWFDCDVLHSASLKGRLLPFVEWVRKRRVLFIGPEHLRRLKAFPVGYFLEVHPTRAAEQIEETIAIAGFAIEKGILNTVLLSAGPSTPTLVSRIHKLYPWVNVIDTGSVWDAYVGVLSRKVFRKAGKRRLRELGQLNFKQEIASWWIT